MNRPPTLNVPLDTVTQGQVRFLLSIATPRQRAALIAYRQHKATGNLPTRAELAALCHETPEVAGDALRLVKFYLLDLY